MDIISLPRDLDLKESPRIQVFDYQTTRDCSKQRIVLSKNTFSFLLEGSKEVITGRNSISIGNTDFLMMRSGHCLMTENLSDVTNYYRSMLLFFPDEAIHEFRRKYPLGSNSTGSKESLKVLKYDAFLRSFVDSLTSISTLPEAVQDRMLPVKFEELMLYLTESYGADLINLLTSSEYRSRDFIQVVETNRLNKLTLKELAFLSNMSVSTFKREFEKHFHESPSKWFLDQRLEHSAYLLKNSSRRPSDIFEEVGYENLSNFIQAFKVKFGVTPKQFQFQ